MKIYKSPYQLQLPSAPNSASNNKTISGCLLKFEFEDQVGYSTAQTWPEFGDPLLEDVLEELKNIKSINENSNSQIINNILSWAKMDAWARAQKQPLFDNKNIKNNYLVTDICQFDTQALSALNKKNISILKFKFGRNIAAETKVLKETSEFKKFKWRIDFNSTFSLDKIFTWLKQNPWIIDNLEYLEDPVPFNVREWSEIKSKFKINLALDIKVDEFIKIKNSETVVDIIIIKPFSDHVEALTQWALDKNIKVVFTSYMDHLIGQSFAAVIAHQHSASLGEQLLDCGLSTNHVFEPYKYTLNQANASKGIASNNYGVGYGDLLEFEPWELL